MHKIDSALAINQGHVVSEVVVCRTPALHVAKVRIYIVNEARDGRNTEGGLTIKTIESCPTDLDSVPAFAMKLLCNARQVT